MIDLDSIRAAVRIGKTVHWKSPAYSVIRDRFDRFYVHCASTGYSALLTEEYQSADFFMP